MCLIIFGLPMTQLLTMELLLGIYANSSKSNLQRYYIDGETTASIQFTPSLACGVGYYDQQAPWGTEWFGKGSNNAGWFNNFRIPFQKSIVVTIQHLSGDHHGFYLIVRGATNIPITVGNEIMKACLLSVDRWCYSS